MQLSFTKKKNIRKNYGKLKEGLSIPNLIEVQKNSYKELKNYRLFWFFKAVGINAIIFY